MATILVTDAERASSLTIIRSLHRAGHRVVAASQVAKACGFASRFCDASVTYPSPRVDADRTTNRLLALCDEHKIDLVIPVTDDVLIPIALRRAEFSCKLAIPADEQLRQVTDKPLTVELAENCAVPVPLSHQIDAQEQLPSAEAIDSLGWPMVIKPASSRNLSDGQISATEVGYANNREELQHKLNSLHAHAFPILLQEYIQGTGCGVEVLASNGKLLAAFQHERLREVPITGGVSSLRKSVPLDDQLLGYVGSMMAELEWTGLAMVEFKLSPRGPRLMEINGRVWGSFPLSARAGMDFGTKLASLYLSDTTSSSSDSDCDSDYRIGVHSTNTYLDLVWGVKVLTSKRSSKLLPTPPRWQAVLPILELLNPFHFSDQWWWTDPLPAFRSAANRLTSVADRGGKRAP